MANEAGINLILKAPDVNSTMDEVIAAWKEITEQEKRANAQLEEYHRNVNKQLASMKAMALENDKITEAVKKLKQGTEDHGKAAEVTADKQKKGIIATIAEYFRQRGELKQLEKQIERVNKELDKLHLKQRALISGVTRGDKSSILQFDANEKRIKELNGTLNKLDTQFDSTSAKVKLTEGRFAGLSKTMTAVGAAGAAAFAVIALAAVAVLAVVIGLGKQNDQVKNQFKKTADEFKKLRTSLSDAFAPVAFGIGVILEKAAAAFNQFITENSDVIFTWARGVAGRIGFIAGYMEAFVPFIGNLFKLLGKDVQIGLRYIELASNPQFADITLERIRKLKAERDAIINETPINPIQNGLDRQQQILDSIDKINFKVRNLTKEQLDAIKKMREEYAKIVEEVNKQINALEIVQAGPIAGILVKSEMNAKLLEKESARYVELARKLKKSQEEIDQITSSFNRLIDATRNQAQAEVVDALTESLRKLETQLEDNAAKQTETEDELKLKRTLDVLSKSRIETQAIFDALQKTGDAYLSNKETLDAIIQNTFDAIAQLESDALEDFEVTQSVEAARKRFEELKKELAKIKAAQDKIVDEVRSTPDISDDRKFALSVEFDANQVSIDNILNELRGLQQVAGDEVVMPVIVDTEEGQKELDKFRNQELIFRVTIEEGNPQSGLDKFGDDVEGAFAKLNESLERVFGEGFAERFGGAFDFIRDAVVSSIDAQIEAMDRQIEKINEVIEAREETVDRLEEDLEREAEFKKEGLANDYDILRDQLNAERELLAANLQAKADAEEKAAVLAEKRRKIQALQDSATQASALITAVANTFKGFSEIPFVGQVLAIAAIAAMFTAFAAAKINAGKLTKAYTGSRRMGETFGTMAPGEGEDDRRPDRGLSVVDRHGRLRGFVGGDEMLMKESVSRKHRDFLWHLNQHEDKFASVNLMRVLHAVEATDQIDVSGIIEHNRGVQERLVVISAKGGITEKEMHKAISKALEKQTNDLTNYFESRPTYRDAKMKDYYVETSKSSIHKKND